MNLNIVMICGRLTKKPELKTTPNGQMVAGFSVATNRTWKDKAGTKQEEVEFHNVTAWGRTAEVINQYFDKGDEIFIRGRLKTSTWQKKDGSTAYRTDIIADTFDFGQKAKANQGRPAQASAPAPAQGQDDAPPPEAYGAPDVMVNPEDIPF